MFATGEGLDIYFEVILYIKLTFTYADYFGCLQLNCNSNGVLRVERRKNMPTPNHGADNP